MINSKKAQLALTIVIMVIIVISLTLYSGTVRLDARAKIGMQQIMISKAYSEGEAAREYIETAATLLVYDKFKSQGCPADINKEVFYEQMEDYLSVYVSPNVNFTTTLPYYIFEIEKLESGVKVTAKPLEKINIYSEQYNFNYSVNGYFSKAVTCEQFGKYNV